MRRAVFVAVIVAAAVACERKQPAEPDPTPTKPTPTKSTPSSSVAPPASADALQTAVEIAKKNVPSSCKNVDRVLLPGAAMLAYSCRPEADRVDLVAPGASRTSSEWHLALEPSVHGFWTPMGPDRKFVAVFTWSCSFPVGCDTETRLHELVGDRFVADPPVTLRWHLSPAAQTDVDKDGFPDLVVPRWQFVLPSAPAGCTQAESASIELAQDEPRLAIDGVVSWVAAERTFEDDLASFEPWYAMRLSAARTVAKHLAVTDAGAGACPIEALRTAAEILLYGRVLGEPEAMLEAEADAIASRFPVWAVPPGVGAFDLRMRVIDASPTPLTKTR